MPIKIPMAGFLKIKIKTNGEKEVETVMKTIAALKFKELFPNNIEIIGEI